MKKSNFLKDKVSIDSELVWEGKWNKKNVRGFMQKCKWIKYVYKDKQIKVCVAWKQHVVVVFMA